MQNFEPVISLMYSWNTEPRFSKDSDGVCMHMSVAGLPNKWNRLWLQSNALPGCWPTSHGRAPAGNVALYQPHRLWHFVPLCDNYRSKVLLKYLKLSQRTRNMSAMIPRKKHAAFTEKAEGRNVANTHFVVGHSTGSCLLMTSLWFRYSLWEW